MSQAKKKGRISLPPNTKLPTPQIEDDKAMQEMIMRGGDVSKTQEQSSEDKLKSFTIKIYESELKSIRELVRSPKEDGPMARYQRKKNRSMQEFIMEAILGKIAQEKELEQN